MNKQELRKNLGRIFMAGLPGPELDRSTLELIQGYGINNFILFRRNVATPGQLTDLCRSLTRACREAGLDPPLISIDQEGGTVARLPEPFTQFPDARKLAQAPEAEELLGGYARTCVRELLGVGINMNLSPVLDVCPEGRNLFMERRCLGNDPREVARLGCIIIGTMQEGGLAACAKHFPGLGGAELDPHLVLPTVSRSRRSIIEEDLEPFRAAAAAGVAAIMSEKILTGMLRQEMGYEGVIVTDDLEMGAIEKNQTVAAASVAAFRAGSDLLLICHEHYKVVAAFNLLLQALADDPSLGELFPKAIRRIEQLQKRFAIIP